MSHINPNSSAVMAGELAFLDTLSLDLESSESRVVYADWLEENGDATRANFLRQYNTAFETMDEKDFPDFETVPTSWAQAIGARLVKGIVDQGLGDQRNDILRVAQPTLVFEETYPEAIPVHLDDLIVDASIPIGGSKLYGRPDLPKGTVWPRQKDCNTFYDEGSGIDPETPCVLVCQINFADLKSTQFGKLCPPQGLLSIFSCSEIESIGMVDAYVVFTPSVDGLERLEPPSEVLGGEADEANTLFDAMRFELTEVWGVPCPGDKSPFPVTALNYEDETYDALWELADEIESNPLSSIGGYTQATSSDDPLPGGEWIKLICVQNSIEMKLHFCIKQADLAAGKFDDVELSWVDFD